MNEALRDQVEAWLAFDPDERDRATIVDLVTRGDDAELERRFRAPLTFGTAGLRGPEMAGPAGMNRATVRRATLGVLGWLEEIGVDPAKGIVVGRDARHGSERFNDEVVAVLLGGGAPVFEMPLPLPTPFVPYCVKALGAAAGIMITASHNPPEDNGYKLYAHDGAQIVPPDDEIVERHGRNATRATLGERSSANHFVVAPEILEEYRAHMLARFRVEPSPLRIVYTPLHGVGGTSATRLLADAGYGEVHVVARQFEPDGDFPTLPFPNPEEPGALDLAMATAHEVDATLIVANDPDADRLGAAIPSKDGWRVLRGDEVGWLLGSVALDAIDPSTESVATTIVSSSMLHKMAAAAGVRCALTLTGFKWVARAGDPTLAFGVRRGVGLRGRSARGRQGRTISGARAVSFGRPTSPARPDTAGSTRRTRAAVRRSRHGATFHSGRGHRWSGRTPSEGRVLGGEPAHDARNLGRHGSRRSQ